MKMEDSSFMSKPQEGVQPYYDNNIDYIYHVTSIRYVCTCDELYSCYTIFEHVFEGVLNVTVVEDPGADLLVP